MEAGFYDYWGLCRVASAAGGGMSKSETGLRNPRSEQMGSRHGTERVRQGQAYGVPRTESRVKVRIENRK